MLKHPSIFNLQILFVLQLLALSPLTLSLNIGADCVVQRNVRTENLTFYQNDFMIDSILVNEAQTVTNTTATLSKCIFFDIDSPRAAPSNITIFGTSVTTQQSTINGCTAMYNNTECLSCTPCLSKDANWLANRGVTYDCNSILTSARDYNCSGTQCSATMYDQPTPENTFGECLSLEYVQSTLAPTSPPSATSTERMSISGSKHAGTLFSCATLVAILIVIGL